MSEQGHRQPTPYPQFAVTSDGIRGVHAELGRLFHLVIEQELLLGKLRSSGERLLATTEALRARVEVEAEANGADRGAYDVTPRGG